MHTLVCKNGTMFHHNSDLSGNVSIVVPGDLGHVAGRVNGDDLLEFVANYVRGRLVSDLEDQTTLQILGVVKR